MKSLTQEDQDGQRWGWDSNLEEASPAAPLRQRLQKRSSTVCIAIISLGRSV